MRPTSFDPSVLRQHLRRNKIADLPELKRVLGTDTDLTVFRKLKQLHYLASYTHRGRFYTLPEIARFDDRGLWSHEGVWFSRHGTLLATLETFVNQSADGYYAHELADALHAGVQQPLRYLAEQQRLLRMEVDGQFLYTAIESVPRRQQLLARRSAQAVPVAVHFADLQASPDELKAAIPLFYGLLDEQQRRLFAGTESIPLGRRRAEIELRRQKELFQKIFENAPVMIVFFDKEGKDIMVNPEWERVTGWTLREIRQGNIDILSEFFPQPQYRHTALDLITRNGEWFEIKVKVRNGVVIDLGGRVVQLSDGSRIAITRDITERKRVEEALRTTERRQRKIAKRLEAERARLIDAQAVAKVGSWETELPSLEVTWSEQTHRIFETDPSHFHPRRSDFVELIHPDDRAKVDAAFQASLDKRAPSNVEYRIVMGDGRVKVLEEQWRVFHDEQGRPIRLVGTCRDVTERKRAEAELRESEARFRLVADSAPVMIWMSGTDKLCIYFNKPWLDFTGRSLELELGNGWAEGVHPEDLRRCTTTYIQAFDRRAAFRMEYHLRRHDGEYRWVLDIGVPRFNPDGSFAGYIGSCIDVTEQRRAEEQLRHAQEDLARVTRVLAMGELAATIAHEVNQPLTAIVTNGQFCLRRLDGATTNLHDLRPAITEIVNDGTRASAVISRIRGLLTKGTSDRTELDINQIIQDVTTLLRNEFTRNRVLLHSEFATDLPRVHGDSVQLQQVLINLIMNAIEATRTSANGRREILIRSAKNPDSVLVRVQDSGPGIEPGLANRIFEPFFTTKAKGVGMGLSISHSIIESHGGHLGIVSSSTGALFEFTLPTDGAGV
jgi:PAS domain S-box-containing protein